MIRYKTALKFLTRFTFSTVFRNFIYAENSDFAKSENFSWNWVYYWVDASDDKAFSRTFFQIKSIDEDQTQKLNIRRKNVYTFFWGDGPQFVCASFPLISILNCKFDSNWRTRLTSLIIVRRENREKFLCHPEQQLGHGNRSVNVMRNSSRILNRISSMNF